VISSSKCGVWFCVLSRCSFISYWKSISVNYKFNQWFWRQRCRSESLGISVS